MGSDLYMNPPVPVTKREVIYHVGQWRVKLEARMAELVMERKTFKVTPLEDQVVILVYTGEWR